MCSKRLSIKISTFKNVIIFVVPILAKCKPQILTRKLNTFTCNGIQLNLIRVHLPDQTVVCYDFTACAIRKHTQLNELNNLIYCTGGCIT